MQREVRCCLLLLLEQELDTIRRLRRAKCENGLNLPLKATKRLLRDLKQEAGRLQCPALEDGLAPRELQALFQGDPAFDREMLGNLVRRLSFGAEGAIGIEKLHFWLKRWRGSLADKKRLRIREGGLTAPLSALEAERAASGVPYFASGHDDVFTSFARTFFAYEAELEPLRTEFAARADSDLPSLFRRFDRGSVGTLGLADMEAVFRKFDEPQPHIDLRPVLRRYCSAGGQSRSLSYSEFAEMFRPHGPAADQDCPAACRRGGTSSVQLAQQIMTLAALCEQQLDKRARQSSPGEAQRLFMLLDRGGRGFVGYNELKSHLNCLNVSPAIGALTALMSRLDRSHRGVVQAADLAEVFVAAR